MTWVRNNFWFILAGAVPGIIVGTFIEARMSANPPGKPVVYNGQPSVTLPLYGAGMQPGQVPNQTQLDRIEAKLDKLLKMAEAEPQPIPANQAEGLTPLSSAAGKCFECHSPDTAERSGGGFKMFAPIEGGFGFAPLSDRQRQQIVKRVTTEDPGFKMPPPKSKVQLTPEEKTALVEAHTPK